MAWTTPQFSKTKVDEAARTLIADGTTQHQKQQALAIINNWRSSHSFPLNTMQMTLRRYAAQCCADPLIAQRLKRMASIDVKLRRQRWRLTQMQDIGGARAVLRSVDEVYAVANCFKRSSIRHQLINEDDYIAEPRESGYRSLHLVYRYFSDRKETYNGLRIELQLRSRMQHAWATAVETVGTFTAQALKSSLGSTEWLRFFALMGSAIAIRESTAPVPGTPTDLADIRAGIRDYDQQLSVIQRLNAYRAVVTELNRKDSPAAGGQYFLLELDAKLSELRISPFRKNRLEAATQAYVNAEARASEHPGSDAVLVSVDSIAALRRAYPNYFADTSAFVKLVEAAR